MREEVRDRGRLEHMLTTIENVEEFTENISLEELMNTWMAKLNDNCIFISAKEKTNMDNLKSIIYNKVRELHVQKYPYNDFLYQTYDDTSYE